MEYTIVYTQEPEVLFTAEVINLPGCVSYGETLEETQEMIKDSIKAYLKSMQKHLEKISSKGTKFISSVFLENETI